MLQGGVAGLPAYAAEDMTFVQEEEVFPALPAVLPTNEEDDEALDSLPENPDAKPGGKRKLTEADETMKKV